MSRGIEFGTTGLHKPFPMLAKHPWPVKRAQSSHVYAELPSGTSEPRPTPPT